MSSTTNTRRIEDLPMATDRAAAWEELRSWGDVFQDANGTWYLTSIEAVQFAARQPNVFSSARAWDWQGSEVQQIPVAIDPPEHARYRRSLDPMIRPAIVDRLEPELRRQVAELIDRFASRGSCDVVAELAALYPTQVFLTLYGLPLSDRDMLTGWVRAILDAPHLHAAPSKEHDEAAHSLFAYVRSFIADKRANPGEDMISRLLAQDGDGAWSNDELLGTTYVMIIAGLDTVRNAISLAFHRLATDPQLRRRITTDPESIPALIEELLRIDTVAPFLPRVTVEDVDVLGHHIPANSKVLLAFGAANRDPARYGCPHGVDTDQADLGHFSFGAGVHRCLGSHLARRELCLVLEEFHKRIPDYELKPGTEPRVVWPALSLKFDEVPLVFQPAAVQI
jgi:cytochrome P450